MEQIGAVSGSYLPTSPLAQERKQSAKKVSGDPKTKDNVAASDSRQATGLDTVEISSPRNSQQNNKKGEEAAVSKKESNRALELTDAEKQEIEKLKARDREVRAHEQAHLGALGGYSSGGPKFSYDRGPDGKQYATSGEVPVDVSEGKSPEETIRKAQVVRRAASAPAQPSAQDRAVAAQASQMEQQARKELAQENQKLGSDTIKSKETSADPETERPGGKQQGATNSLANPESATKEQADQPASKKLQAYRKSGPCPLCHQSTEKNHSHLEREA